MSLLNLFRNLPHFTVNFSTAGDATFHRRITIPVLLVYGLKDPLVSLVEMCEMERTIPKAYLELVPLAGHMVMSECPRDLNVMCQGRDQYLFVIYSQILLVIH